MVSDLKTFAHKGCKIAAQFFFVFSANFDLLAGFFWYRCYYPHRSRELVSPVCGIFPKDSEYLKSLDVGLWEVGAKRRLNGVNK